MTPQHFNPEQTCVSQQRLTHSISALGHRIRAWVSRAVNFFLKWNAADPSWLDPGETYSRQARRRYEIYTEDIGPIGLKNIQILLDQRQKRLPGSTVHPDLFGRDRGNPESSLTVVIETNDEEAILELAAEIRRCNGQIWVGISVINGTFIEISGPKKPTTELRDHPTSDNSGDGSADQMHAASGLKSVSRI